MMKQSEIIRQASMSAQIHEAMRKTFPKRDHSVSGAPVMRDDPFARIAHRKPMTFSQRVRKALRIICGEVA